MDLWGDNLSSKDSRLYLSVYIRQAFVRMAFELGLESQVDIIYKTRLVSTRADCGDEFLHVNRRTTRNID
jgi:hypothetical protein